MDDILDAEEVAKMLHVHPRTIMRLAGQGQIPGFKIGGQWRFRREAIEEHIRQQEQKYSSQKPPLENSADISPLESDKKNSTDKS